MTKEISRRDLVKTGAAAALGAGIIKDLPRFEAPNILKKAPPRAIVCSHNAYPHSIKKALELLEEGKDTLDCAVAAVNMVEDDPNDDSVGYGGLPNEEGIVELDASCMHGPSMNAGSVGGLRNIRNPSSVARDILWLTDHVMLVGEGALKFAVKRGYKEENLLTASSREKWLKWKASLSDKDDWLEPGEKMPTSRPWKEPANEKRQTGTVHFSVLNEKGEVSGVTSTSGLSWKIPGRVGDSPIIGAGLYVDGEIGAGGGTGRGESNMITCGSHLIVEAMRAGMHPKDACLHAVKRALAVNKIQYLWKEGRPLFQLNYYAVDVKGRVGGASVFGFKYGCAFDGSGPRIEDTAYVIEGDPPK